MINVDVTFDDGGTIDRFRDMATIRIPNAMREGHFNVTNYLADKVREYLVPVVSGESRRSIYVEFGPSTPYRLSSDIRSSLPWMVVTEKGHFGQRMPPAAPIKAWMAAKGIPTDDRTVLNIRRKISFIGIPAKRMFRQARYKHISELGRIWHAAFRNII
jgi:hypothetical protein